MPIHVRAKRKTCVYHHLVSRMEERVQTEMRPADESGWSASSMLDWLVIAFKAGGFMAAVVGGAGMVANILLSDKKGMTIWRAFGHVCAAGFVGWLAGQAMGAVEASDGMKTACAGIAGAFAVELKDACLKAIKVWADKWLNRVSP